MNPRLSYQEILNTIDTFDPVAYAKTRNHLSGAVSRLSPYITRGVISLPAIKDRVLLKYSPQSAEKFIQELAWREYFQKVYQAKGEEIFGDLRFSRTDWNHSAVVTAIKEATTGITTIDESVHELYKTGYMHNHARMWTAMLATNVARAHWFTMSKWLFYHLIDGDLASNTLSWQWVAGTSVAKRYVANQSLINGCSQKKQHGTYLDVRIEDIEVMSPPLELEATEPFLYQTMYPIPDRIDDVSGKTVLLYHPWSIDPLWRKDEAAERIFVIETARFDRFPISPVVMKHMLTLVETHLPGVKVFVGAASDIPGIESATVYSKAHPTTRDWPGHKDPVEELFPRVTGYHQSFFKFWQACQER